ncbi:MAG TPA: DUF411 domain-containing protein [Gemmatimonadales bacterium]|jgi:hypothetical protein|nr:DUF411 domain-containing protein [Gemmatimonadales bacterium]
MQTLISRRAVLARGACLALGFSGLARLLHAGPFKTAMLVYKDPGCGCCEKWVELMRASGFAVAVRNTTDMQPIKRRYQVPPALASCHTALVEGYVIEGHVPSDLIRKLLKEKPKVVGLTVPGMVTGSPGMEGPNPEPYQVLAFDVSGKTSVYAKR